MSGDQGLVGRDCYLRFGNGPVQCFRVWDAERFIRARMDDGANAKPPYVVEACDRADYLAERKP